MNPSHFLTVRQFHSLAEFTSVLPSWNDLWERSTTANPMSRGELIAAWTETKKLEHAFRALAVVDEKTGSWIAAVPLIVEKRHAVATVLATLRMATPHLLIDSTADPSRAFSCLVRALTSQVEYHWICLEALRLRTEECQRILRSLVDERIAHVSKHTSDTSLIPLRGDFAEVLSRWNQGKVKEVQRLLRKLPRTADLQFVELRTEEEVLPKLATCFEIEDASWKGHAQHGLGIKRRGQESYFEECARLLCRANCMHLFGLELDGKWIAFQYDYAAKGTLFCSKISYLPDYRQWSPGFLLHYLIVEHITRTRKDLSMFDYVGEYQNYQLAWNPELDPVGCLAFPTRNLAGRLLFKVYQAVSGRRKKHHV